MLERENDVLKAKLETLTSDFQALLTRLDAADARRINDRQENIEATKSLVMYNRLTKFTNTVEILYSLQFGFRKNHSTSLALIHLKCP